MERTCEERASDRATHIAAGIANDSFVFAALKVAAEPEYSQRRNGAYVILHTAVEGKLRALLTGDNRDLRFISDVSYALEQAVAKPGATPDTVCTDAAPKIAELLLPIFRERERQREEMVHLMSTDWVALDCAF